MAARGVRGDTTARGALTLTLEDFAGTASMNGDADITGRGVFTLALSTGGGGGVKMCDISEE